MSRGPSFMAVSLCTCLCALAPLAAFAQTTAQISGRVTDASGAVVPGVDVTLTNLDTGVAASPSPMNRAPTRSRA